MRPDNLKTGIEIIKYCSNESLTLHMALNIFRPSQEVMDMLLKKDNLKVCFNNLAPDNDILIFHDSDDKYPHNGSIRMTCFLSQKPEVLECVRKHQKVSTLIKKLEKKSKRKGGDINC